MTTEVIHGDSLNILSDSDLLADESIHAIVTDPPYGIDFGSADWDDYGAKEYQEWCEEWARKALRVVKPGGHMLVFSANRTFHRLMCGVEDAGWQLRDTIMYLYGSGFPKGSEVSSHIRQYAKDEDAAQQWDGWKTQLKPAFEPVALFRKPLSDSAYKNVLEHGTGALNIESCRISAGEELTYRTTSYRDAQSGEFAGQGETNYTTGEKTVEGRFPANVVLDEAAAQQLDEQTGTARSSKEQFLADAIAAGVVEGEPPKDKRKSRFFYTAKASTKERTHDGEVENDHPTVKPLDLMEWLITLVTAEGQAVLDPFAGSGSTLLAAERLERNAIGLEREDEYVDLIDNRLQAEMATIETES